MTSYTSQLIDWGEQGAAYPATYSYTKDVPPIEEYDDFAMFNLIKDVKHLISLTNTRLDSASGNEADKPTSPTDGLLFWNTEFNRIEVYDSSFGNWRTLGTKAALDAHMADTTNPHNVTAAQAGAPTTADLADHESDTTNPHNVTAAQTGAYTEAETRSWVNNSADVPNADYADTAGNAATVGGKTAGELTNPASTATESTAASVNFSGSTGYNSSNTKHVSVPNIYVSIIKRTNFTKETNYANFRGFSVRYTNGIKWSVDSATAWFPPLGPIDRVSVRGYQSGSQVYDWSAAFDVYSPAITPHDHNL